MTARVKPRPEPRLESLNVNSKIADVQSELRVRGAQERGQGVREQSQSDQQNQRLRIYPQSDSNQNWPRDGSTQLRLACTLRAYAGSEPRRWVATLHILRFGNTSGTVSKTDLRCFWLRRRERRWRRSHDCNSLLAPVQCAPSSRPPRLRWTPARTACTPPRRR